MKKKNKLLCDLKKVFPNASYFVFDVLGIVKYKYERKLFKDNWGIQDPLRFLSNT